MAKKNNTAQSLRSFFPRLLYSVKTFLNTVIHLAYLYIFFYFGYLQNVCLQKIITPIIMSINYSKTKNSFPSASEKMMVPVANKAGESNSKTLLIRFEQKKEQYIWAQPDEIIFVKSADHYVKSLVMLKAKKAWVSRHSTIKKLLSVLPPYNFIRLNKFYLLNLTHFSHIDERKKLLYFTDNFSVPIPHRISPFILDLIKK